MTSSLLRAGVAGSMLLAALFAGAQQYQSIIQTYGEATVDAAPDWVEFWIHWERSADSVEALVNAAQDLEDRIIAALDEQELSADETLVGEPRILDAARPALRRSARVRFRATPFFGRDDSAIEFARLCDAMRAVSETLDARLAGPRVELRDTDSLARNAVARAVENAYPLAESTAELMQSRISAVDSVEVLEIRWERIVEGEEETVLRDRITCTAQVRVTYAFGG